MWSIFFKQLIMCWCQAVQAGCARWPHEWPVSEWEGSCQGGEEEGTPAGYDRSGLYPLLSTLSRSISSLPSIPAWICTLSHCSLDSIPRLIAGGLPARLSPPDGSSTRLPSATDSLSLALLPRRHATVNRHGHVLMKSRSENFFFFFYYFIKVFYSCT